MSTKKPETMDEKEPQEVHKVIHIKGSDDKTLESADVEQIVLHQLEDYAEGIKDCISEVLKETAEFQSQALEEIQKEDEAQKLDKNKQSKEVFEQKLTIKVERAISDKLYSKLRKMNLKGENKDKDWLVFVGSTFCFTGLLKKKWKYIGFRTTHFNMFIVLL